MFEKDKKELISKVGRNQTMERLRRVKKKNPKGKKKHYLGKKGNTLLTNGGIPVEIFL